MGEGGFAQEMAREMRWIADAAGEALDVWVKQDLENARDIREEIMKYGDGPL